MCGISLGKLALMTESIPLFPPPKSVVSARETSYNQRPIVLMALESWTFPPKLQHVLDARRGFRVRKTATIFLCALCEILIRKNTPRSQTWKETVLEISIHLHLSTGGT